MRYVIKKRCLSKINTFYRNVSKKYTNTDKWYFAYTIDGDTITVVDARHAQNMRD